MTSLQIQRTLRASRARQLANAFLAAPCREEIDRTLKGLHRTDRDLAVLDAADIFLLRDNPAAADRLIDVSGIREALV